MAGLIYILDTNTVSGLMRADVPAYERMRVAIGREDTLILCQPVYYELLRGLLKTGAINKLAVLRGNLMPFFVWTALEDADWEQAARFWVEATGKGRQFSDVDLLVAAIATRLNGILVSADADFDALPITREDWREPPTER